MQKPTNNGLETYKVYIYIYAFLQSQPKVEEKEAKKHTQLETENLQAKQKSILFILYRRGPGITKRGR